VVLDLVVLDLVVLDLVALDLRVPGRVMPQAVDPWARLTGTVVPGMVLQAEKARATAEAVPTTATMDPMRLTTI